MAKSPIVKQPGLVFYRPAVDEILKNGTFADLKALIKGAKLAKTKFKDFDGLIAKLETAVKRVQK